MTIFPVKNKRQLGSISESSSSEQLASSSGDQEKSEPLLVDSSSTPNLGIHQELGDVSDVDELLAEGEGAVKKKRRPRRGEDFEFREALIKADFWLLFLSYFLGVGSGVTVLNNLAQIGISVYILWFLLIINGPYCICRSKMLPRTMWMTCTQIIMVLVYILFAYAPSSVLYASTALLGICYGFQFSVMVPTASELFGLKHFGVIYNFMLLGNPLGALFFSALLAGSLYDKEAAKQHAGFPNESKSSCFRPDCFRITFLFLAGVCTLGSVLTTILTLRIRPVYQMLYSSGSFRLPRSSQH